VEHPPSAGVVKFVGEPLVFEELEPFRMEEERLSSPQVSVLFTERVQVNGAPNAGPLAPDDHYGGRVDGKEDAGAAAALVGVLDGLARIGGVLLAASRLEAHEGAAK